MEIKIHDAHLSELAKKDFKGKSKFPQEVVTKFRFRINQIKSAKNTKDLRAIGSLHFEKLKAKEFEGKYSIRVKDGYRLIFGIENEVITGLEIIHVDNLTNHYS
jgi:proteic killer suppression protein